MPDEYLSILWELWMSKVIEQSHVIKALKLYGYQLSYIGNSGMKVFKKNETIEYKYGATL